MVIGILLKIRLTASEKLSNEKGSTGLIVGIVVGCLCLAAVISLTASINTNTGTVNTNFWTWLLSELGGVWS